MKPPGGKAKEAVAQLGGFVIILVLLVVTGWLADRYHIKVVSPGWPNGREPSGFCWKACR
jgi:hypothetical protein